MSDEIIDKKKVYTASKKVRGRRSKLTKNQKFKLADVSSDDSLYEPELSYTVGSPVITLSDNHPGHES
jgi:hypothetical protein